MMAQRLGFGFGMNLQLVVDILQVNRDSAGADVETNGGGPVLA